MNLFDVLSAIVILFIFVIVIVKNLERNKSPFE